VYTYKGSYGTEDRGFYAYKSDEVLSVTDKKIILKPKYTYSDGVHTFWLMHCNNRTTDGSCTGGWGTVRKKITISNPSPETNCTEATKRWKISAIKPNYTDGKVGFTIDGNFPNSRDCLRRQLAGRGFSAVYTFKGSYGTEPRGYYAYKTDQVQSVTDTRIILKPRYTYSEGTHTFWVLYCTGNATNGVCKGSSGAKASTVKISKQSDKDSAQVDLTVGKTGTEGVENTSAGFSVRVCNQGQGSSNGKYKLEVINNTNTSKKYRTSGSWDVPAPGRCGSVISFDSYPCGRLGIDCDGSYDITVKVDPEDNISETNENNNTKQFSHASDPGGCKSNSDCSGNTPVCDAEKNTCVECTSNGDCKSGERCNVSLGKCEQGQTDCTTKQYGDANCDGKYDLSNDFMEWRAEFRASATDESHTNDADGDGDNWDADFDDDGGVRISDFSIWRSSFQKVQRGTPVP
jgi:Cys-rich repeat protein